MAVELALQLVNKFVEKLGGTIWIESQFEIGTKVYFKIPLLESFAPNNPLNQSETIQEDLCCGNERSVEINGIIPVRNFVKNNGLISASREILKIKSKS